MNVITQRVLVLTLLSATVVSAQESSRLSELIVPTDRNDTASLQNSRFVKERSFFASQNRASVVKINYDLLLDAEESFTISPFEGVRILVRSSGHQQLPNSDHRMAMWIGEIIEPRVPATDFESNADAADFHRIELDVSIRILDRTTGQLQAPRSMAESRLPVQASENANRSEVRITPVSKDSKLVHLVYGDIYVAALEKTFRLTPVEGAYEFTLLIEVDEGKQIMDTHGVDPDSEAAIEARRRAKNYKDFLETLDLESHRENRND